MSETENAYLEPGWLNLVLGEARRDYGDVFYPPLREQPPTAQSYGPYVPESLREHQR